MPRYFFDLHDDFDASDDEGRELSGIDAAKAHAVDETRVIICASVHDYGRIDLRHSIHVRDDGGQIVAKVRFEDAVRFVREGERV